MLVRARSALRRASFSSCSSRCCTKVFARNATTRDASRDAFLTNPPVAKRCLDVVEEELGWDGWSLVLEPSAGSGAFLHQLPAAVPSIGLDKWPQAPDIEQADFFDYAPTEEQRRGRILTVGNPPFGRCGALAARFFNHTAQWGAPGSDIAFILPRVFRTVYMQNRLNLDWHLEHDCAELEIAGDDFEPRCRAKCCFQIWVRRSAPRSKVQTQGVAHPDWTFLPARAASAERAHFRMRSVGAKAGAIADPGGVTSPNSWLWIEANCDRIAPEELRRRFAELDFSPLWEMYTTALVHLPQYELVRIYSERHGSGD